MKNMPRNARGINPAGIMAAVKKSIRLIDLGFERHELEFSSGSCGSRSI
jgi:hypothetical protein